MCIYLHIFHSCIYVQIYVCVCISCPVNVYVHAPTSMCIYVCIYIHTYIHIFIYTYKLMYVCTCIYLNIYTFSIHLFVCHVHIQRDDTHRPTGLQIRTLPQLKFTQDRLNRHLREDTCTYPPPPSRLGTTEVVYSAPSMLYIPICC